MSPVVPLALGLGPPEIILILLVLVLLFGAKKLPELARGSGRALRIFKSETKGLMDDDDVDTTKTDAQRQIEALRATEARPTEIRQTETVHVERSEPRSDDPHR